MKKPQDPPSRSSNQDGFETLNANRPSNQRRRRSRESSAAAPRQARQPRRGSTASGDAIDEEQAPGGAQILPLRKKKDPEPRNIFGEEDASAEAGSAIVDIEELEEIYSPAQK